MTLRRFVRSGRMTAAEGWLRLAAIARLSIERVTILPLLPAAFALRDRFGAADVFYAVVARESEARLITLDERLARACEGYVEAIVP